MFQTNMVQSLLKGLDPIHQKSISLTPGQIFNGKITKLYPGQLASLQLGNLTLTAKLEAALTAGNRYWFQVQPGEGLPVLKVLQSSGELDKANGRYGENVLRQLGINNTRVNEMIVNFLAKEELPFSRQHVKSGAQTLQSLGMANERGLSILEILVQRNLPITPTAFLAIQSVVEGQGFSQQLHQLSELLRSMETRESGLQQVHETVERIISAANIKVDHHHVIETLKSYFTEEHRTSKFINSQNELLKLGLTQKDTVPSQLLASFKEMITFASSQQLKTIWPTLTKEEIISEINKGEINNLFSKIVLGRGEKNERIVHQLLSLFAKKSDVKNNSKIRADQTVSNQLTSIIKQVGFQYERDVMQFFLRQDASSEKLLLQLKSLLINAQQLELPAPIQDKIEAVVHRITGQQLLSVHQEGPIANHAVMVPLKLLGLETDLTIQWEGKKQKNEELNPDHCRILFYIHLNSLKETIVDVQIQNRIVSLHIINDNEKPLKLIGLFQPFLKDALVELNYKLSSIKWIQPKRNDRNNGKQNAFPHSNEFYQPQRFYQGVDIRI